MTESVEPSKPEGLATLKALYINCTLKPSPALSHTEGLMKLSESIMRKNGGFPSYGNQRSRWDAGARFNFENPEYR